MLGRLELRGGAMGWLGFVAIAAFAPMTALAQPQPVPMQPQPMQPPLAQPQPMPPQAMPPQPMQPQPQPGQPGQTIVVQQGTGATVYTGADGRQVVINSVPQDYVRPDRLPFQDGEIVPNGYVVRDVQNTGLLAAGASVFGTAYLPTLITGLIAADDDAGWAALAIPVIGPLVSIGTTKNTDGLGAYFLVLDFLTQGAGVAMFSASFATHGSVLRRVADGGAPAPTLNVGLKPGGASLTLNF